MKDHNGYTLIELLIVTAIISILAATALPQFYPFKTRAYDADAKANLHNVFLSCKGFWAINNNISPCILSTVSNSEYGFIQSSAVEVTVGLSGSNNTETDFYATASHIWSSNVYVIDNRGVISLSGSVGGGSGGSGSGSGGSGSGGSSGSGSSGSGSGSSGSGGSGSGSSGSGGGGAGNKNKGCSEEAQSTENKGSSFGKSAKGGCA